MSYGHQANIHVRVACLSVFIVFQRHIGPFKAGEGRNATRTARSCQAIEHQPCQIVRQTCKKLILHVVFAVLWPTI